MTLYSFTTLYIIAMEIFLTLTLIKMFKFSNLTSSVTGKAYTIFGTWLLSVLVLFGSLKILPKDISSVELFTIILIGVVLSGIFFYLLKKEFLSLPQEFLLLPQGFRMFFGAGFLAEAVFGIMPSVYGVLDGILHITTAFLALTLAIYIAKGYKVKKSLILINLFGLLDIVVVAAGIAFIILKDIGSDHNVFLAVFYAAPIFIWLHLISLYKVFKKE